MAHTPNPSPSLIALVDDADHARERLHSWLHAYAGQPQTWLLIACAPRMTHRISKWVSHSSREHWREKWADKLFLQLLPALRSKGHGVHTEVARSPLPDWLPELQQRSGCEVLDWRKPRSAETSSQPIVSAAQWTLVPAFATLAALQELA